MAHLGICFLEQLVSLASSQTEAFSQLLIKDDLATTPRAEILVLNRKVMISLEKSWGCKNSGAMP